MQRSKSARRERAKYEIDLLIHGLIARCGSDRPVQAAFRRLIEWVRTCSDLTRVVDGAQPSWGEVRSYLFAMLALCRHHKAWCREVESWQPAGGSRWEQFGSLARHLLAVSPVPEFLMSAWFETDAVRARALQKIFKHLGRGGDIRGANLPVMLSREMARQLHDAPADLSLEQAVRWAQVRGLDGTVEQARLIADSRIGRRLEHDEFEARVSRLISRAGRWLHDSADPEVVSEAVKRQAQQILARTIRSLKSQGQWAGTTRRRRAKDAWRRSLSRANRSWYPQPIRGLVHHDDNSNPWSKRFWTIRQLLETSQLKEEGAELRHCVAWYGDSCARGQTSIWSLKTHGAVSHEHLLTITLDPSTRTITYASGFRNSRPSAKAKELLQLWADREDLKIDSRVLTA